VRVIKRPSGFEFRNPGALRVPVAQALKGGESDCRNRTLQQMFLMINLGERAGSGLPRILTSWQSEGRLLKMTELFEPYDQSLLTMNWALETVSGKMSGKPILEILSLIRQDSSLTISELAITLELSERTIERAIQSLRADGRLERIGPSKGGFWKVLK
jgi:predicted HTH transcriptional regulator